MTKFNNGSHGVMKVEMHRPAIFLEKTLSSIATLLVDENMSGKYDDSWITRMSAKTQNNEDKLMGRIYCF